MNDLLSKLNEESRRLLAHPMQESFIERKKREFAIDDNVDYPDPEYLIEIGGTPTLPKGNLVAVSAKWKNGKTFFCDILSAIFLGSDRFAGCRPLFGEGKVAFFDTEQAENDTARAKKIIKAMTPEQRHSDLGVYCLRNADIDRTNENGDDITRYEFISQTIAHDKPDLVIIDGIADLIYNYNDVIESQRMVNRLATLANKHNCAIIVVMHQNKSMQDKNMKGHIGTMLYQKCSDVFQVEKHGSVFVASHPVSRHLQSDGLAFKLDADAIPVDAVADRRLQTEMEIKEMLIGLIPEDGTPVRRSDIVEQLVKNNPFRKVKAYDVIKQAIGQGWLIEVDRSTVKLKTDAHMNE